MKPIIKPITNLPIKNFLTGEEYHLSSFDSLLSSDQLKQMVEACNQPLIFNFLFKTMFGGRKYNIEDAKKFESMNIKAWKEQKQFIFLIKNKDDRIISMLDIKSLGPESEIGYWSDVNYPGLMTNALTEIISIAKKSGYKSLHALILPHNKKSISLSERLGFRYVRKVFERKKHLRKYTLNL